MSSPKVAATTQAPDYADDFSAGLLDENIELAKPSPAPTSAVNKAEPTLPAPAAEVVQKKFTHSRLMANLAYQAGLTDQDLEETSPEELKNYLDHLETKRRNQPAPINTQPPEEEDIDLGLPNIETYDDHLVAVLKKQAKTQRDLEKRLAERDRADQQAGTMNAFQQMDAAFTELNQPGLFGSGPMASVTDAGIKRRRTAVVASIQQDPPKAANLREAIRLRAMELFGVEAKSANQQQLEETKKQWNQGGVAVPTARQPSGKPKGEKAAVAAVAKIISGHFGENSLDSGGEDETETLLG
jgi:hypothetical protein